jgi:hypothetical protein
VKVEIRLGPKAWNQQVFIDGVEQKRCIGITLDPVTSHEPTMLTIRYVPDEVIVTIDGKRATQEIVHTFLTVSDDDGDE